MNNASIICKLFDDNNHIFDVYDGFINDEIISDIEDIIKLDIKDIVFSIKVRDEIMLNSKTIPMFSDFNDCTNNICYILDSLNNPGIEMVELGKYLRKSINTELALYKYGETHSKAASMLGLTKIIKKDGKVKTYLTNIGYFYLSNKKDNEKILTRLLLHSHIIQKLIKNSDKKNYLVYKSLDCLSEITIIRRMPNIKTFVNKLCESNEYDFNTELININFDVKDVRNEL